MRILVAGGSGAVGREVARIAAESGLEARTLARSSGDFCVDALDRAAVGGVCRGVTAVVSCLGASVSPRAREKRPFSMVDTAANRNLIKDARSCGVKKFVYVAAHVEPS